LTGKGPAGKRRPFTNALGRHGKGLIGVCEGIWGEADTGRAGLVEGVMRGKNKKAVRRRSAAQKEMYKTNNMINPPRNSAYL